MIGKADIIGFMQMNEFFAQQQAAAVKAGIELTEAAVDAGVQLTNVSVQAGIDLSETANHAGMEMATSVLDMQKKAVDYLYSNQPGIAAAEGIRMIRNALTPQEVQAVSKKKVA